jgi:hypothetical protein
MFRVAFITTALAVDYQLGQEVLPVCCIVVGERSSRQ